MGKHDKLASGLARQAYRAKQTDFFAWREETLCEIGAVMELPARGEALSQSQVDAAADAIRRCIDHSGCAIHSVEAATPEGMILGSVLLTAGRRCIDGREEDGTTLTAQAVTFILESRRTGIIARHLDLDLYQHAMERFIGRDARKMPEANPERDQAFFDNVMGIVLVTDFIAMLCGELARREGRRGIEMPISVPMGSDLLLGRVLAVEPVSAANNLVGSEGMFWEPGTGYRHERGRSRRHVDGLEVVMVTEIRTHVPGHALHPDQKRLRQALEGFRRRHADALLSSFERQYLFSAGHHLDDQALDVAFKDLCDIISSRDWAGRCGCASGQGKASPRKPDR